MTVPPGFRAYGDFNCPFCYALNERLTNIDVNRFIEWRMIQHAPLTDSHNFTIEEQSLLAEEVFTVRHTAPELPIALPPTRPNTQLANNLFTQATRVSPAKADSFKQLVFHALWVDGRDISDKNIVSQLHRDAGLGDTVSMDNDIETKNQYWKSLWENGPFDQRIPALESNDQRVLLGLSSLIHIKEYFEGISTKEKSSYSCKFKQRHVIAVAGNLKHLWPTIEPMRHLCDIRIINTIPELNSLLDSKGQLDLLLIDKDHINNTLYRFCLNLAANSAMVRIPVMVLTEHPDLENELIAYEHGVADYLRRETHPQILKAKIGRLLQLKRSTDILEQSARIDNLTQIYNRREFEHCFEQEWKRCSRAKTSIGLLMIDIDYFKYYNDYYGHLAGDGCLRLVAQTLKENCNRATDIIARYGGEEFVTLMPNTDQRGAKAVASELLSAINELEVPHAKSKVSDWVTVSIGISCMVPEQQISPRELLNNADKHLYTAKSAGRNQICASAITLDQLRH